jgi:hypothetical protein
MANDADADHKARGQLQDAMHKTWMGIMGAFTSAEGEVHKATHRLLEALGVVDGGIANELRARIQKNRAAFEKRIDDGVKAAVDKVRTPIERELETLRNRMTQISARLDAERQKRKKKKS